MDDITREDGFVANIKVRATYLANLWNYIYNFIIFRRGPDVLPSAYETIMAIVNSSKLSLQHDELYEIVQKFRALISNTQRYSSDEIDEFFKQVYQHPLLMPRDVKFIKKRMREHTGPWKVEWLAKVLHPSRVQAWCYDMEEIAECRRMGMIW